MYTNLSGRYADARLAESSAMPDITILDKAAPSNGAVTFRDAKIIGTAILLALGLGLGLAIMLDRLDFKFRHLAQVNRSSRFRRPGHRAEDRAAAASCEA